MVYANCHFYCADLEWLEPFENRTKMAATAQKEKENDRICYSKSERQNVW